jgi:IS4 transposase
VTQCDAIDRDAEREPGQQRAHIIVEHAVRPAQAGPCEWDAALVAQAAERDQVVITRHTAPGKREHAADALVGQRAVPDQVAGAEVAVELLGGEEREHRLERVRVRVDVRNDPVAHYLNLRLILRDGR